MLWIDCEDRLPESGNEVLFLMGRCGHPEKHIFSGYCIVTEIGIRLYLFTPKTKIIDSPDGLLDCGFEEYLIDEYNDENLITHWTYLPLGKISGDKSYDL